jgi:hypothetical protein
MGAKARNFDLLGTDKNPQTPFWMSMIGFRQTISKHLGLKALPFISSDNKKAVLSREQQSTFPYGYFILTSFEIKKDSLNVKSISRHASSVTLEDITNSMIQKAYMFPATLEIELHFVHNDIRECLSLIEKVSILGAIDKFSFKVDMPGCTSFMASVNLQQGPIAFPQVELENPEDAAAFDIVLNFSIDTKVGIVKSVPKINNQGTVTSTTYVGPTEEES